MSFFLSPVAQTARPHIFLCVKADSPERLNAARCSGKLGRGVSVIYASFIDTSGRKIHQRISGNAAYECVCVALTEHNPRGLLLSASDTWATAAQTLPPTTPGPLGWCKVVVVSYAALWWRPPRAALLLSVRALAGDADHIQGVEVDAVCKRVPPVSRYIYTTDKKTQAEQRRAALKALAESEEEDDEEKEKKKKKKRKKGTPTPLSLEDLVAYEALSTFMCTGLHGRFRGRKLQQLASPDESYTGGHYQWETGEQTRATAYIVPAVRVAHPWRSKTMRLLANVEPGWLSLWWWVTHGHHTVPFEYAWWGVAPELRVSALHRHTESSIRAAALRAARSIDGVGRRAAGFPKRFPLLEDISFLEAVAFGDRPGAPEVERSVFPAWSCAAKLGAIRLALSGPLATQDRRVEVQSWLAAEVGEEQEVYEVTLGVETTAPSWPAPAEARAVVVVRNAHLLSVNAALLALRCFAACPVARRLVFVGAIQHPGTEAFGAWYEIVRVCCPHEASMWQSVDAFALLRQLANAGRLVTVDTAALLRLLANAKRPLLVHNCVLHQNNLSPLVHDASVPIVAPCDLLIGSIWPRQLLITALLTQLPGGVVYLHENDHMTRFVQ